MSMRLATNYSPATSSTGYPWSTGDELYAADLNAAIANSAALGGGVVEAPSDGQIYARQGSTRTWVPTVSQGAAIGFPLMLAPQPAGGYISSPFPFGTMNECVALSCQMVPPDANGRPTWPQVNGYWNTYNMAGANDGGGAFCTFYCGTSSTAPTTITVTSANYTVNTLIPSPVLTPSQVSFIQSALNYHNQRAPLIPSGAPGYFSNVGMTINTQHSTMYVGSIVAVAADGSSVTVDGWYQLGHTQAGQIPPNGVGLYINPANKIWGMNGVMSLNAGDFCKQMTFLEMDCYNNQPAFSGGVIPQIGISANAHGNLNGYAYVGQGPWYVDYLGQGANYCSFLIKSGPGIPVGGADAPYGFVSQVRSDNSNGHHPFAYYDFALAVPQYRFVVGSNGGLQLGAPPYDNGLSVTVSAPGTPPVIASAGPDTNINIRFVPKGTGVVECDNGGLRTGNPGFNNGILLTTVATGTTPQVQAIGLDTNVTLRLTPKGTALVQCDNGVSVGTGGPTWTTGTGAPATTQPVGSMYSNTSGAVGATLYVSRGAGTWVAVAGV